MLAITFACSETLPLAPDEIGQQILDLDKWSEFRGYGPIPGIKKAEWHVRLEGIVGSRVRVINLDGSTHVEEILHWDPRQRIELRMGEFSPPLSHLATSFDETWELNPSGTQTQVTRSFRLNAKSWAAKPALWLISRLLKRAVARHLQQLSREPADKHVPTSSRP